MRNLFTPPVGQHGKTIKLKNLRNSWSKWGGGGIGLENRTPEWNCQICGEHQPKQIDPFVFPLNDREFLRICPKCQHKKIKLNVVTYEIMVMVCREKKEEDLYHEF